MAGQVCKRAVNKAFVIRIILLFIALIFSQQIVAGEGMETKQGSYDLLAEMMNIDKVLKDEDFIGVSFNKEFLKCSPGIPGFDWLGIQVNLPKKAYWGFGKEFEGKLISYKIIPLCAVKMFDKSNNDEKGGQTLVVLDKGSEKVIRAEVVDLDSSPKATIPEKFMKAASKRTALAKGSYAEYFNINIQDYIKLPEKEATYLIHIEENGYKSNVVELKVEKYSK